MTKFELRNLSGHEVPWPPLTEAAEMALAAEGAQVAVLSLALVDDDRISQLNQRLLNHEGPTDVISFEVDDEGAGEIIISVDTAARQAAELGHSLVTELRYLVVHGVLHTLGYCDDDETSRKQMIKRQDEIIYPH
jgi:probable rRNA maturation factor